MNEYYNKEKIELFQIKNESLYNDDFITTNKYIKNEEDCLENKTDKISISSLNNVDSSYKKLDNIETKSNSHSFNNSMKKSQINFHFENGFLKNSLINNNSGNLKNFFKIY